MVREISPDSLASNSKTQPGWSSHAAIGRFLANRESPYTRESDGRVLEDWRTFCARRRVDVLQARDLDVASYRDALRRPRGEHGERPPLANSTVRKHLAVLSSFYRWAIAQPDLRVPHRPNVWVDPPPRTVHDATKHLIPSQARHLLDLARDHSAQAAGLVSLCLHYGQAPSGVRTLLVSDYDPAGPTIRTAGRGGRRERAPLLGLAAEAIPRLAAAAPGEALFPGKRTPALNPHAVIAAIVEINATAPTPLRDSTGAPLHITPSILHATFLRAAAAGGAPARDVAALAGIDLRDFLHDQPRLSQRSPVPAIVIDYLDTAEDR